MKLLIFLTLFLSNFYAFSKDLMVGVISSAPPFADKSTTANGVFYFGFSIDIMNSICKRIRIHCVYTTVTLPTQFKALDDGRIDLLLLANPYQPEQLAGYAFSLPYLISKVQFITTKNSTLTESTMTGVKIGVAATTFYDLLKKTPYKNNNEIVPFNSTEELIAGLMQHKVDVILLNSTIAYNFIDNNTYNIKVISKQITMGDGYGIVSLPNKAPLIKEINAAILSMQADGTYTSIYSKYYNSY
jgi:ABC-type amino acid transport substrate-binding protein